MPHLFKVNLLHSHKNDGENMSYSQLNMRMLRNPKALPWTKYYLFDNPKLQLTDI